MKNRTKKLKKEIVTNSAIHVGYSTNVINKLPNYAIISALRETTILINDSISDIEIQNYFFY